MKKNKNSNEKRLLGCERQTSLADLSARSMSGIFFMGNNSSMPVISLLIVIALSIPSGFVYAENEQSALKSQVLVARTLVPTPEGMSRKKLRGKVGAKNLSGLAIVYEENANKKSAKEIWMPYESETYLDQYNDVESIQEGDEVTITYDEGEEETGIKKLRGISLVRKAPVEQEVYDPNAEPDDEAAA